MNYEQAIRELEDVFVDGILDKYDSPIMRNQFALDVSKARKAGVPVTEILAGMLYTARVAVGHHPSDAIADVEALNYSEAEIIASLYRRLSCYNSSVINNFRNI